jgi:hypothetical protein
VKLLDLLSIILYLWIIPVIAIWIIFWLYRRLLTRDIVEDKSATNEEIIFNAPKEFDKFEIQVYPSIINTSCCVMDKTRVYVNNREVTFKRNRIGKIVQQADCILILELKSAYLRRKNALQVKHDTSFKISYSIRGERKKVRKALMVIMILIILTSIFVSINQIFEIL